MMHLPAVDFAPSPHVLNTAPSCERASPSGLAPGATRNTRPASAACAKNRIDAEACLPTARYAADNERDFGVSREQLTSEIYTSSRESKRGDEIWKRPQDAWSSRVVKWDLIGLLRRLTP